MMKRKPVLPRLSALAYEENDDVTDAELLAAEAVIRAARRISGGGWCVTTANLKALDRALAHLDRLTRRTP